MGRSKKQEKEIEELKKASEEYNEMIEEKEYEDEMIEEEKEEIDSKKEKNDSEKENNDKNDNKFIDKLKNKKTIFIIAGIVFLILMIFLIVFINHRNNVENDKKMKKLESKLLRQQREMKNWSSSRKKIVGIKTTDEEEARQKTEEKNASKYYKKYENMSDNERKKIDAIPRKEVIQYYVLDDIEKKINEYSDEEFNNNEENSNEEILPNEEQVQDDEVNEEPIQNDEISSEEDNSNEEILPNEEQVQDDEVNEEPSNIDEKKDEGEKEETSIPSKFDLRDKISIKVADQKDYGLCWDFAAAKSVETYLALKYNKNYDLSEIHTDYITSSLMYGDRPLHGGGSFDYYKNYLKLTNNVLEEKAPYDKEYNKEEYNKFLSLNTIDETITDVVTYPSMALLEDIDGQKRNKMMETIKKHIMNFGSLYAGVDGDKIDFSKNTINCKSINGEWCIPNHAISIIGWDDDYSKNNFENTPNNDGAFIALNSWGKEFGENGIFYISYEDELVLNDVSGVVSSNEAGLYKISDIKSDLIKNIINEKLGHYIISKNNEKYISKLSLEQIKTLNLSNMNLNNDDIEDIKIFENLNNLDLSKNNITSIDMLLENKRLQTLDISNNPISNIERISEIESLFDLNLSMTNVTTVYPLKNMNPMYYVNLNLSGLKIEDYSFLPPSTGSLTLKNTNLTNLNDLPVLNNLAYLNLANNNLTSLDGIRRFPIVQELNVSNNPIKDYSELSNLHYFNLEASNNNISDISIFNDFDMYGLNVSNNNITSLDNFKNNNISGLDLSNNNIVSGISKLNNISILDLSNSNIKNLKEISKLENLSSLDISNNNISDYDGLKDMNSLSELSIANNTIDTKLVNNSINFLNMSHSKVKDFDIKDFENLSYINVEDVSIDLDSVYDNKDYLEVSNAKIDSNLFNKIWENRENKMVYFNDSEIELNLNSNQNNEIDLESNLNLKEFVFKIANDFRYRLKNANFNKKDNKLIVNDKSQPIKIYGANDIFNSNQNNPVMEITVK